MTTDTRKNKLESIVKACRLINRMNKANPDALKSDVVYYDMLASYCTRALNAKEEGKFLAAHTIFFPTEILYAMDIVPMHTETMCWMASLFTGNAADILAAGADLHLAPEICSAHRGLAGAFHIGALPRPDVMLWSNLICDNTAKSGELIMELEHCPGFFLDQPFRDTPTELNYLVGELKDLIIFLEKQSGHKLDYGRLSGMVTEIDKQIRLYRQIEELRKAVPSPFPIQGFLQLLTIYYLVPGQPEATLYLQTLYDEMAKRVKAGKGAVSPERFRLMTLFIPPVYRIGFLDKLFKEHGAVSVVEPLFTRWGEGQLDPAKPLESVARKTYLIPERCRMYGPMEQPSLDDVVDCAKQYKVDGAIYWAFIGCRHTCATIKLFKDTLNKIDIPMLTVDCDILDPTINSQDELRQKLEQFFELLEDR